MSDSTEQPLTQIEASLGRMVYTAAAVEMMVEATGALLASDPAAAAKLKGKTIGPLKELTLEYGRAADYLNASMMKALTAILDGVSAGMDQRNAYVHGAWAEQDGELVAMNSKPVGFRIKPLTVERLDQITAELVELRERLTVWWTRAFPLKYPEAELNDLEADTAPTYPA